MSVSFFKHKKALVDAYKDVLSDTSDTDWALFTYEGKDNELKVAGTGDEGLEELESEFHSSKIMYAFIKVKDPNTSLNKFIFLHWQGEGAPANRKGACANHVMDVQRFFKGAHITINARNEDDVTPEQIMQHVTKASASTYTFDTAQKGGYDEPAPVGSVYKRINPEAEISSTRKETYWEKQERDEEKRKKMEESKRMEERKKYEQELRENEKESSRRRSEWEKAREEKISEKMHAAKLTDDTAEIRKREKEKWETDQREFEADSERSRKRSESIEKAAEAASLVHGKSTNPHAMWQQRIQESNTRVPPREPRKPSHDQEPAIASYEPRDAEPEQLGYDEEHPTFDPEPTYDAAEPVSYDATRHEEHAYDETPYSQDQVVNADVYEDVDNQQGQYQSEQQEGNDNYAESAGYQARTLYDYQAADDSEITFDPDVVITDINMVDEGWWQGKAPDGSYGLFPANYVELIQ